MSIIELGMNVEEMAEYEPLPDGMYPAECREVEVKYNEKNPAGYIVAKYLVDPSNFPADYDAGNAPEGLELTYARTTIPDGSNRRAVRPFKEFFSAHGVDPKGAAFNPDDLIGKEVQLLVKKSEYNGALVNNVEALKALPSV